jgi:DNA-binding GntR family transcriptional regulator
MSFIGKAPRYISLAESIRARIESGEFAAGERLPSEAEFSAANGVSRGTVVRAVEQLVAQGYITRRQGSGSYVSSRSLHRRSGDLLSFSESARRDGHRTGQRLVEFRVATHKESNQIGVSTSAMMLRRIRLVDGVPCSIHRSIIPQTVCRRIPALADFDKSVLERSEFSLYALFEQHGMGVEEASERLTARLSTRNESDMLHCEAPSAVIVVCRLSYGPTNELIEAVEAVYRADYYTYDAHLMRGHRDPSTGLRHGLSARISERKNVKLEGKQK